ncbi:MAG: hypothetical protein JF887_11620 [Candidatus Dormibacteraeota bacterium]|uniref:RNA polymerase sigma-70 region 2 domain-containing protein n=1 Tax=Candidatus Amunia macphersoniae TaxID=3127014 RepID=A0A934KIG8_9BACT|nr:hypothetical protein [Candidatus Dormibacteraeota bacterium]
MRHLQVLPHSAARSEFCRGCDGRRFFGGVRSWHRVDPAFGVDQWLFRIARNTITDHYRAQRRRDLLHSVLRRGPAPTPRRIRRQLLASARR